jgi:bacterioferritin-associated ferredoxin
MNKAFLREPDSTDVLCPRCQAAGESVLWQTVQHHVPPEKQPSLSASSYFCPTPNCPVAYFDAFESTVLAADLVRPVYPKDPAAPICPCFGLTEADVRLDVEEGTPRRIRELVAKSKSLAARCGETSPTGRSCLPEVQKRYFKLRG